MITIDQARVQELRDFLAAHPKSHDQSTWVEVPLRTVENYAEPDCGTTGCAAGWTCLLNGDRLQESGIACVVVEGQSVGVPERAQELLGLNNLQCTQLFFDCETHQEVLDYLDSLLAQSEAKVEAGV